MHIRRCCALLKVMSWGWRVGALLAAWPAIAQPSEFRGFWAEAWSSDLWSSSGITRMVEDLRSANCNALIPQVRRRGDALYHSHFEPKCHNISAGFDPLADLIAKAHDTNAGPYIEVHAWLVTYHVWKASATYPLPPQPDHPVNLHPDWLLRDINGNTVIGGEYTFDPGHPEVQRHTFNVCMDLLTNYAVDGINFDYIRYSSANEGYNPVTVERFNRLYNRTGTPSTGDAVWKQFRRDQVTALLRKVYLHAIALRPEVKVSCDTITWSPSPVDEAAWYGSAAWNNVFQDWRGWMQEGILDLNIPMTYFRQNVHPQHYANWSNFAKDHRFNRHVVIGPGTYLNSAQNAILQMRLTREPSPSGNHADGVCVYDYQVTNTNLSRAAFLDALVQPSPYDPVTPPIFAQWVPTPTMPWKTAPTKGHLKGFVYGGGDTNALDGAVVTVTGSANRTQTSDATGFYGFVDLPPGDYTVSASFPGWSPVSMQVTVTAGMVATHDLALSRTGAPVITLQPQDQSVAAGDSVVFSVSATGTGPVAYQWRHHGTNLGAATASSLQLSGVTSNQAGPYDVRVSNAHGAVTSAVANLTVVARFPFGRLTPLWSLAPNSRPYLTVNGLPNERGMAFNPVTRRLLLVNRAGPRVYVLDAETGADLHELNMAGVTGGYNESYYLLMIGAAEDGAVYAGNLTLAPASVSFKIYRWANDNPATAPTVAFSGDPNPGGTQRWGDTLDVRRSGANTQIIIGSRSGNVAVVFTTTDGLHFTGRSITVSDAAGGGFGLGLAFGAGNTFWGKAGGLPLRQVAFDLAAGTGSSIRVHSSPDVLGSVAPIGVHPGLNLLAGIHVASPNHLQLYDLALSSGTPVLLATNRFTADNDNTQAGTGAVDFGSDALYALCSNNGILALRLTPSSALRPQLGNLEFLSDGHLRISGTGEPGTYTLERSTDLIHWQDIATTPSAMGSFQITDSATNAARGFYRARWRP